MQPEQNLSPLTNYGFMPIEPMNNLPLFLLDLGVEAQSDANYHYDNQLRENYKGYLYQYTLSGHGILEIDGQQYSLSENHGMFLSFPNNYKYYYPKGNHKPWVFFYLHFNGSTCEPFSYHIHQLLAQNYMDSKPFIELPSHSTHVTQFIKLYKALHQGKKFTPYEDGEWLYQFLSSLVRDMEKVSWQDEPALVSNAKAWIQTHYANGENLSDMSYSLNRSLPHITRQFKESTGLTPIQYMTRLRLEHSLTLLLNTSDSICSIATQSGFRNANYFAKVFNKSMNSSPTAYRNNLSKLKK